MASVFRQDNAVIVKTVLGILFFVLAEGAVFADDGGCDKSIKQVAVILEKAGICNENSECRITTEMACPFGCQEAVNKNADLADLIKIVQKCRSTIVCESCVFPPAKAICQNNQCAVSFAAEEFQGDVRILTDKKQYHLKEHVRVTIRNDSNKTIWLMPQCGAPFFLIPKKEGGREECEPYPTKGCQAPPVKLERGQEAMYDLELRYVYTHPCKIEPGLYKFRLPYSESDLTLVGQRVKYLEAFSNEFSLIQW